MVGPRTLLLLVIGVVAAGRAAAEDAPRAGDARRGEALFTGAARFANLGAPCLACHGVGGHGLAHAASFGPDLSDVYARYGPDALDSTLADVPFPSMAPLYATHAVTPSERADLEAFLRDASTREAPRLGAPFILGVAGLAGAFLLAFVLVGRRGAAAHRESP